MISIMIFLKAEAAWMSDLTCFFYTINLIEFNCSVGVVSQSSFLRKGRPETRSLKNEVE